MIYVFFALTLIMGALLGYMFGYYQGATTTYNRFMKNRGQVSTRNRELSDVGRGRNAE